MGIFILAILHYDQLSNLDVAAIAGLTESDGIKCCIILAIYILKAVVFVVPASLVYIAVGGIFSHSTAIFLNLFGIFLEITVTYFLGRFLGKDAVERILSKHEKGQKFLKKNIQGNFPVVLGIRAIPAFPIDFVSLFCGASNCSYGKYALASVLGISWRVIAFTILGSALFDWIPLDKIILAVICCIPIGVIIYLIKKFAIEPKREKKNHS